MFTGIATAQEKYAVLICGKEVHMNQSVDSSLVAYTGTSGFYHWTEFWAEIYNTWEMLVLPIDSGGMGFYNDKVFVLYADGIDFSIVASDWIADKYNAQIMHPNIIPYPNGKITDYSATLENVEMVFNGLATGQDNFPQLTQDDFLFVWTFGHGMKEVEETGQQAYLMLYNGNPMGYAMSDTDFATLTNQIICEKKVFWMMQCHSGGFIDNLENNNTIINTAVPFEPFADVADDSTVFENEVINDSIYHHAEVYFHLYSAVNQKSPDGRTEYDGEPLSVADSVQDNVISIWEGYKWAKDHESVGDLPQYSDLGNIRHNTSLRYPTLLHEDMASFGVPETHRGIIGISKTIHVLSGCQLKFKANANIHLLNQAKLIVDAGGSLIIEDNDTIFGSNLQNQIVVNGSITIGENVYFTSENNTQWQVLQINNTGLSLSLQNVDFNNCGLTTRLASISLDSCDFTNGSISHTYGNILVNNAVFYNGGIEAQYANGNQTYATVQNSSFTNSANFNHALVIESYPVYTLSGLSVSGYLDNAIEISNSGYGATGNHLITENSITGNGTSSLTAAGLYIYNSYADVVDNEVISLNPYGIQCLNNSDITLTGNRYATYDYQTQQIRDNAINQVYATRGSFPREVKWNAIVDEDNTCLFKYVSAQEEVPYDVEYNYWGENFSASHDLCPNEYFDYIPLWDLQPGGANIEGAALVYAAATNMADSGNYTQAKMAYQGVVNTWPESKYAQASLKKLFAIEPEAGNNLSALKSYFLTIDDNETLETLAGHLAAFCDVAQANWQPAIDKFEEFIQNPASYEDSLFAIIDLAHTHILMEQCGFKAAAKGILNQYAFSTATEYENCRDHHISLLFAESDASLDSAPLDQSEPAGRIFGGLPNPFSGTMQISFALNEVADIKIYLINELGQNFEVIHQSSVSNGLHRINFSSLTYKNGMYVCVLEINGKIMNTQKVMIMN